MSTSNAVKNRLKEYLKVKRISFTEFGESIGASKAFVNSIRVSISHNKVMDIKEVYPDLNTNWLLYGEGEMFNHKSNALPLSGNNIIQGNNNSHISQINGSSVSSSQSVDDAQSVCLETGAVEGEAIEFLPVVPAKLAQSADEDTWQYIQQNPVPRQPVVMQFPEYHTTLQVRSDAMAPRLRSGDHVALRHMGRNPKVMNGEVYCFDTRDGGLVIREGTNIPGGYRLHARSERYADDVLMYEEVLNVYEVVGAVIMNI